MEPKIDKTITTKKGGNIIIPRKIIRSEYPESSSNPGENVIKTSPQNLTEEQQNQARKNQGLYYSEPVEGKTITFDGNIEGKETVEYGPFLFVKVADNPKEIPIEAFDKFVLYSVEDGQTEEEELEIPQQAVVDFDEYYRQERPEADVSGNAIAVIRDFPFIIVADNFTLADSGINVSFNGIYFIYGQNGDNLQYVSSFTYTDFEYISKIDNKYLNTSENSANSANIIFEIKYSQDETAVPYVEINADSEIKTFNELYSHFLNKGYILARLVDSRNNINPVCTANVSLIDGSDKRFVFIFLDITEYTTSEGTLTGQAYQNAYEIDFVKYNNRIYFRKYSYKLGEYTVREA